MNTVYVKTWFLKKIETEKRVNIFSFVGTVLKETEKAVFVKFEEAYNQRTGADYVESWVPKSCLLPAPAADVTEMINQYEK